ncbi:MAG: histidine phosphatase family protein [Cephaloticoccus sp.]|nr:histidine phosphatase family protein [Cephaloticoccus sp.]MCF7759655.1 histidine phosphatase family protein [Cephaloticoccus sp.]
MQGHELLETIAGLSAAPAVAAVMRHAARHPIANPSEPTLAELTPEGAKAAVEFGSRLTGFDRVRLFHSPVKRCGQTAAGIAQGATAAGLAVELVGAREEIGVDYILDLVESGRLSVRHGDAFVRLWVEEKIPATVVRSPRAIAARQTDFVAARLREPTGGGRRLDLHVSHDWNIILLREMLLEVRYEEAGWLTFLDGVAFTADTVGVRAIYRQQMTGPLPA